MNLIARLTRLLTPLPANVQTPSGAGRLIGAAADGTVRVESFERQLAQPATAFWHPCDVYARDGAGELIERQLVAARRRALAREALAAR